MKLLMSRLVLGVALMVCARVQAAPDVTLSGSFSASDNEIYREVAFDVPPGVTRLSIHFDSNAAARSASLNLAVRDPERMRGWSGEVKSRVLIGEVDASPGYLPGPLVAGRWILLLGADHMPRDAGVEFVATISFERASDAFAGFVDKPVRAGPAWYRGDLHMHSGHSDGSCKSMRGVEVPCPVFPTLVAARAAGLDFMSLTDHNTVSQTEALRELAPYFDDLLVIPGQEVTMFRGHANVFGPTKVLDFNVGGARGPGFDHLLNEVEQASAVISINHPGADCCLWRMEGVEYNRVHALEVINGGNLDDTGSPEGRSSFPLWEKLLDAGYRIAGISGSDNHDAPQRIDTDRQGVGRPTVVVYAAELSQAAVLEAIRGGHAFIDVWGAPDRFLEAEATAGPRHAMMGDTLQLERGAKVTIAVHVRGVPEGARISVAGNAIDLLARADLSLPAGEARRSYKLTADGRKRWIRFDVRDANGVLVLVGNPIYLWPAR